ncbi:hypothetical protein [Kribbella sp. NPDC048928]|uniref:hypothetical protein n=1 Tax=Kribbella sp. NPDC048928 TaxID=3364111 RepID=UPI0037192307
MSSRTGSAGSSRRAPRCRLAAYDAPFPDERYLQGARQFPLLIPLTPYDEATVPNRKVWTVLRTLSIPFLYVHADHDYGVGEGRAMLREAVPGAPELVLENAGHFDLEDRGREFADVLSRFMGRVGGSAQCRAIWRHSRTCLQVSLDLSAGSSLNLIGSDAPSR